MASRSEVEAHPVLPITYLPRTLRSKGRQYWLALSGRKLVLYLTGLLLAGFVLQHAVCRGSKETTLHPKFPSYTTTEACPPASSGANASETTGRRSLDRLQHMVDRTKGFLARDYSLWLGWNNMRYIIEAGVLQAALLNRTLIIPSFVYARQCEYALEACAAFLEMVNRGDAMDWDEWRSLPMDKQMGWKIPIGRMIDLDRLRDAHAVITMDEYLRLRSLPPSLEHGNGQWSDNTYRVRSRPIRNSWWDPPGVIRVDEERLEFVLEESNPLSLRAHQAREDVRATIESMMESQPYPNALRHKVLDWLPVQQALMRMHLNVSDHQEAEIFLRAAGFEILHTFRGSRDSEFIKSVAVPIKQVARRSDVHGAIDDFGWWADHVVHLQGEVHDNRKPGFLRFTNPTNFQNFTHTVLYEIRSLPDIEALAVRIDERMRERTGGRMWRAAHVRRGDFINMGWSDRNLQTHMNLVKSKLNLAPAIWREMRTNRTAETYEIPDAHLNPSTYEDEIPQLEDPFYIATEERSSVALDYMRSQGGVLIMDLLKPEDRQIVGWPLMVTDILALAEQHIMARASYFYGNSRSSVTGGVLNLRAINGWDPRTNAPE